jgi:molybdate transport system substrate-binding protein
MSETLRVLATGALESAVGDLARAFKRETGHQVALTVGNAGAVARRVEAGEPFGLVMSSSAGIDALIAKGHLIAGSKVDLGDMRLGIATKAGAPAPDLQSADSTRAALGAATVAYIDPAGGGTAGGHIVKILDRLGLTPQVMAGGVKCPTGHAIVNAVAEGPATLGITQASEIIGEASVGFGGYLPDELQLLTRYCAGLPASRESAGVARDFLAYLQGSKGAERFRQAGWVVAAR